MTFLRNAWYCAAWAAELGESFLARKMLNRSVLLYRTQDGSAVAIGNRCPHRFAPLNKGKRIGDHVECPYHGLVFDRTGACVSNPHENGGIPAAAKVPAYPLHERNGIVWIWMGDPQAANPDLVPDYSTIEEREGWGVLRSKLVVNANYEMVADNLLDLSHVRFLHPFLGGGEQPANLVQKREMTQVGDTVWHLDTNSGMNIPPLFALLWGDQAPKEGVAELWGDMRWDAPSNLYLDTGMTRIGALRHEGPMLPFAHLLTPETESTTHYFWGFARNCRVGEPEIDKILLDGFSGAFANEDEPMITACYELMDFNNDLMSMRPVLLPGDSAAVRARRILADRISREQKAGAAQQ